MGKDRKKFLLPKCRTQMVFFARVKIISGFSSWAVSGEGMHLWCERASRMGSWGF